MAAKPTFDLGGKDRPGKADVLTFGIARTADRGRQCLENGRVGNGACQGTCRVHHADAAFLSDPDCTAMLITTSRSGFKATASTGFQLRVWRDQREGLRSRACRYTA